MAYSSLDNFINKQFLALSKRSQKAIHRLMAFELSNTDGFKLRRKRYKDMYAFDWQARQVLSQILRVHHPIIQAGGQPSLFDDHSDVGQVVTTLEEKGYAISQNKFLEPLPLEGLLFKPKAKDAAPLKGRELLAAMKADSHGLTGTYWLHDQNTVARMPEFARIAFDPYILSVVSGYLGCTPIHVQTCLWFSFAGQQDQQTLSRNAQFFHQDKEFVKFIKVFIYLNDVTTENGPHCYIEGSHKNELNQHGIPYSQRVTDEEVINLYGKDKLKVIEGAAGTIIFGDTVSAHKGMPLKTGNRLMLQLEYAASLYMSPVCPFEDLSQETKDALPPELLKHPRLFANYDTKARQRYLATPKRWLKPKRYVLGFSTEFPNNIALSLVRNLSIARKCR